MLAYLFWHRPHSAAAAADYQRALSGFHAGLGEQKSPGFRGSASFRVSPLPWLGERPGYEDWCLVEGSWALDPLNAAAVSHGLAHAHDAAAARMEEGHGGLYAHVWGDAGFPDESQAVWLTRPRGIDWRPALQALRAQIPQGSAWRRQMVLGPGREFVVVAPPTLDIAPPPGWTAFAAHRIRLRGPEISAAL